MFHGPSKSTGRARRAFDPPAFLVGSDVVRGAESDLHGRRTHADASAARIGHLMLNMTSGIRSGGPSTRWPNWSTRRVRTTTRICMTTGEYGARRSR